MTYSVMSYPPAGSSNVITVDGPAASGKGTLAKRLAARFGYAVLDTGLLYRGVGWAARSAADDPVVALKAAQALDPEHLENPALRSQEAGAAASKVAAIPEVRAALLEFQRNFARSGAGAVLDGRDCGTVICPDAPAKLFVTAHVEVRAQRRWLELQGRGESVIFADVLQDLIERDRRDSSRAAAPLVPAADAFVIDSSQMGVDAVVDAALAYVSCRISNG